MDTLDIDIARTRALHGIACGLTRLKWLRDAERLTLAMHRQALAPYVCTMRQKYCAF